MHRKIKTRATTQCYIPCYGIADTTFVVTNFLFYLATFEAKREIAKELCEAKHEKRDPPFFAGDKTV